MFRTVRICASMVIILSCKQQGNKEIVPYFNTPDFTPLFIEDEKEAMKKVDHVIGNFSLSDHHGQPISTSIIKDKIHVANFFFTGCGSICPGMMQKIKKVAAAYQQNNNVLFLSYTVTPWRDSVPRLFKYAQANGFNMPQWHLLTGPKAEIYSLARRSYFAEESIGFSKDSTEFLHTEHVLLIDRTGRIRGIYNGTLALDMEQLSRDISNLLDHQKN